MTNKTLKIIGAIFLFIAFLKFDSNAQEQKFAALGDFKLESGAKIKNCRIGYRTYGKLNAEKSNTILVPTWAGGTTEQLASSIVKGGLIDPAKYFVITIDALGNGVSSSPSDSRTQPRMKFPQFTLRDAVNSQHEVLTQVLKINHLKAVMGVSMGGMQTFQWLVSFPDFMDKAIPVVGSPQLAPYDLVHWQTQIDAIMNDANWKNGDYETNPARDVEYGFGAMILTTPEDFNRKSSRQTVLQEFAKAKTENRGSDANNKIRQTQAIMALDITEKFGGDWTKTASAIKAKVFVIVARRDHTVTPEPAINFAKLINAPTLILESDCGHLATICEGAKMSSAIADFLDNKF